MVSEDWNLKWRTSFQDNLVLVQYLTRKYKNPTPDQFQEISYALAQVRNCFMYWNSDTAHWEKTHSEMPLTQSKVKEQNKYLEVGISAEDSE